MTNIPFSLYIHIPWCVQKCPYCDFNSHGQKQQVLPEKEYIAHLLADLNEDAHLIEGRTVSTIFIGGGTPSLFSSASMQALLKGVRERVNLCVDAEITMEANPGTLETRRFSDYVEAGINRFSIGVQSFSPQHLKKLGRIHSDEEASRAASMALASGVNTFNLDLMHGLPDQSLSLAMQDLKQAIALAPPHISWYQLTIEPNTAFASRPPTLPDDDTLWEIQKQGHALLESHGYAQYEISAYSRPEQQCQHNLNYWRFGDYLGIGCGAHGKITLEGEGRIIRTTKIKHPRGYMSIDRQYMNTLSDVDSTDRPFEFFMNRFRLVEPCPKPDYEQRTGQSLDTTTQETLRRAVDQGWLIDDNHAWQVSALGRRYLNSLLAEFV